MSASLSVDFIKCHGAGNDFIVIDETMHKVVPEAIKSQFAILVGNRKQGIGADGIIFVSSFDTDHPRMRFFNPDGSIAEMSGNGIRCASRVCFDGTTFATKNPLIFETLGGRYRTENFFSQEHNLAFVSVKTDTISTNPEKIVTNRTTTPFINQKIQVGDSAWNGTIISIGNPHLIVPVDDLHSIDLMQLGHALEHHPMFINRTNVSFVQVIDPGKILVQTHERGVGLTFSCGTGMTSSVIAQVLNGSVHNHEPVEVHTAGGIVWVTPMVSEQQIAAQLTGNATFIYQGTSQFQVDQDQVTFATETVVEKNKIYGDETEHYAKLVNKSQFDSAILKGTSLESLQLPI